MSRFVTVSVPVRVLSLVVATVAASGCTLETIPCTTLPGLSEQGFFDGWWSIETRCAIANSYFEPENDRERLVQIEILQGKVETVVMASGETLEVEGEAGSLGRGSAVSGCEDTAGWTFTIPALAMEDFAPRGDESYVLQFSLDDEDVTENHFVGRIDIYSLTSPSEPRYGFRWAATFTRDPSE